MALGNISKSRLAIVLIVLLAAAIRMVGLNSPLLGHHSWREADTAAIARNFAEEEFNILHPRVDWRGDTPGYVECEFPVYQYLVASVYECIGVHEWAGRALTVLFSCLVLLILYLMGREIADEQTALWASFFFAIMPMSVYFGRTFQPESMLLACCITGIYCFMKWSGTNSPMFLVLSAVLIALACLIKPYTLWIGLPLAFIAVRKLGLKAVFSVRLWAFAAFIFVVVALWYYHAHQLRSQTGLTFGSVWDYGTDKWGNWGILSTFTYWRKIFIDRMPRQYLCYLGVPILLAGLLTRPRTEGEKVMLFWLIGMFVFSIIAARGTLAHDYYLLPATVPISFYLGKVFAGYLWFSGRAKVLVRAGCWICLIGIAVFSVAIRSKWWRDERPERSTFYQLAAAAREKVPADVRIVTVDKGNPVVLYLAHRKGWRALPREMTVPFLQSLEKRGARYLLGINDYFEKDKAQETLQALLANPDGILHNDGRCFIVAIKGVGGPPK